MVNPSRPPKRGIHGDNAHKHVKGRRLPIFVDRLGLLPTGMVPAASVQAHDGALWLLAVRIWADRAYTGALVTWLGD